MTSKIKPWMTDENELTKAEFGVVCEEDLFVEGPFVSTFGDNCGEPYNPSREAWGTLKDGKQVWAWVRGPEVK